MPDLSDVTDLIATGTTAALALYSGISGNPVNVYPVSNPQPGMPGVAQVPSQATSFLSNPIGLLFGAVIAIALLWRDE